MAIAAGKSERILVIDDDPGVPIIVRNLFADDPLEVASAATLSEGMKLAAESRFDAILLDHLLPDGEGLEFLQELLNRDRLRPVVYVTAHSGSRTAIEAMKRGAFDYLSKPFDFDRLKQRIEEALECRRLTRLPVVLNSQSPADSSSQVLIGTSPGMQDVYKAIGRLAGLDAALLIEGEIGTGKELVARAIYQHSARSQQPFYRLNCADFTPLELSEELFGRVATESNAGHPGRLAQFHGATMLIEELSAMTTVQQSRLMRVLREHQFESPPGSAQFIPADVRLIFTSTISTEQLLASGAIRSDLYYLLQPMIIRVPPLRQRRDDIDLLVTHIVQRLTQVTSVVVNQSPPRVSAEALNLLHTYAWPGNVAQLESVVQSALLDAPGAVLATERLRSAMNVAAPKWPIDVDSATSAIVCATTWDIREFARQRMQQDTETLYGEAIGLLDRMLLEEVLKGTHGNQARAAKILGMTRTSLRRKIANSRIKLSGLATPIEDALA